MSQRRTTRPTPEPPHQDTSWIKFIDHGVSYNGRLAKLVADLTHSNSQTPTLVFFLGKQAKDCALDQLFPYERSCQRRTECSRISLQLDRSSKHADHPIMFADCDPSLRARVEWDTSPEVATRRVYPSTCDSAPGPQLLEDVLNRVLFTFTDVICLFADDCGGLLGARSLLSSWANNQKDSRRAWKPHVIVASRATSPGHEDVIRRALVDDRCIQKAFASATVVVLPASGDTSELKRQLSNMYVAARVDRIESSILFSANHVSALFERALDHYAHTPLEDFNFVRASRFRNEITEDTALHVENFLSMSKVHEVPSVIVCSFLASATLVDAYPVGMHSKFFFMADVCHGWLTVV